jgi:two-component system sensor kinase FixL
MTATAYEGSVVASPAEPNTDRELHAAINRLFVRRTQIALATLLVGMAVFSIADLWGRPLEMNELLAVRGSSVLLVAAAYALLRGPRVLAYAPVITWLVFALACVFTTVAGVLSPIAAGAAPILCVLLTLTAGALFPWGPLAQVSAAVVAAASLGVTLYQGVAPEYPSISYQGIEGVVVCLTLSVISGIGARRRLLALIRDSFERRHAEAALHRSNQRLERRVHERITEIQAAKQELTQQIAANHRIAAALRERESLLRAIIDNSKALIFVKDIQGRFLLVNAAYARIFGHPCEEMVGKTPYDLHPAAVAARFLENDQQVLAANQPVQFEETVPQSDGEHTYLSVKFVVRDRHGAPYGIGGIATDITERKRMEGALRRSQATLSALVENSDEGIWALDDACRIQLLNAAARQRFPQAYGTQPAIGADLRQLLPANVRAEWDARLQRALSGERVAAETTISLGGATQQFLVSFNPIRDARGVTGVTIFVKDITALKRAVAREQQHQAELAQVLRRSTMGDLAAELAHEINQPLGAIANYAQGSRRRLDSGDVDLGDLVHAIDQISGEAQRAADILERLERTILREPARQEAIDVNQAVRDALSAVELRCTGVPIQLNLAPELPPGRGDFIKIEQVVLNLLHNAVDAVQTVPSAARRLTVATRRADRATIEVAVHDTGNGLDPAMADKIFQPFVTTKSDGLGMGLAISRSIVAAHHGHLWVTSERGCGCTFRFTLPVAGAA